MKHSQFVIINGFDRSGTSAIVRTLALHPQTELIMQPFNSGFLRKWMYQIPNEKLFDQEANKFFTGLTNNFLDNSLIQSHWHDQYSTTRVFVPEKIHLIKTTINHFLQNWMNLYFPEVDVWGIWRNPYDILRSLISNGFTLQWYTDAFPQIFTTIKADALLSSVFMSNMDQLNNEVRRAAFLVAVRSFYFFYHLPQGRVIDYQQFCTDNNYLNVFFNYYQLNKIDLFINSNTDLNIIGTALPKEGNSSFYAEEDKKFVSELFQPLMELMAYNHNIS